MARPPGPVRTCVGCRERAVKAELLRVVAVEVAGHPVLTPDPAGRLPGRGASVHRDPGCVDLAEKRRAFPRALRLPGPLDVTPVRQAVAAARHAHTSLDESRSTTHELPLDVPAMSSTPSSTPTTTHQSTPMQ